LANGRLTPFLLGIVLLTGNNRRILGEQVNGSLANASGRITTLAILAAGARLILACGK
jgi:Mn2+/Fe2+ NRAMP family transporter